MVEQRLLDRARWCKRQNVLVLRYPKELVQELARSAAPDLVEKESLQ
jgi:hypothetical protein